MIQLISKASTKNHITMINITKAWVNVLEKKATIDPKLAFNATSNRFCSSISTISTKIKGTITIPNGGRINEPRITPINAAHSPFLLPPNRLTK